MSVFTQRNHLFGRHPQGGITDFQKMHDAGFGILLANIGDFDPDDWEEHRMGCAAVGMGCFPWLRTCDERHVFLPEKLDFLIAVADEWDTPFVVNSESELDGTGGTFTTMIAEAVGDRDAAVSSLAWPMNGTDWEPIGHLPVLPQLFTAQSSAAQDDPDGCIWQWHHRGVRCVVPTLGSYGGQTPDTIPDMRLTPFGVYTADDMHQDYAAWSPEGTTERCGEVTSPPTNGGNEMQVIGTQHGITAAINRIRDKDPAGTLLQKSGNKWPPLDTLSEVPLDQWKAYDKLERTLRILKQDHDEALGASSAAFDFDEDDLTVS